jgi:hypothetical protein
VGGRRTKCSGCPIDVYRPVNLGIVGHAADKFTVDAERLAKSAILGAFGRHLPTTVVSGHCHLGGVDLWAEELAAAMGIATKIHAPRVRSWGAPGGYRDRNLAIARDSDLVLVVVVRELPAGYTGMRFGDGGTDGAGCYHCLGRNPRHVKSGACFTAWHCRRHEWAIL